MLKKHGKVVVRKLKPRDYFKLGGTMYLIDTISPNDRSERTIVAHAVSGKRRSETTLVLPQTFEIVVYQQEKE